MPTKEAVSQVEVSDRAPHTASGTVSLTSWLAKPKPTAYTDVFIIRTSSRSRRDFEAMFRAGVALRPNDPDVKALESVGHRIVLDEGAPDRARLGAMELRRGSVSGGKGSALLGWLVPIGKTLFVLYLETARKADIAGPTKDQARNAFTEALCEIVRTLTPQHLYAPLFTRLVRNVDFGSQLMRTLTEHKTEVWVEGKKLDLSKSDAAQLKTLLDSWFASTDANALVSRLGGIEAGIYAEGSWYLTAQLLPFTWRPQQVQRVDPITGEVSQHVPDARVLEVTPGSEDIFDEFVSLLTDREKNLRSIGVRLGARGVCDRAPKNFANPKTLDQLAQPGHAVSNLIQQRWLDAWHSGVYCTQVALKSDLRDSHPAIAEHTAEREDGSLWLDVAVELPMPERGYWLTDEQYNAVVAVRKAPTPQRVGRAASNGDRRPLSSLAQWDAPEAGRQWRLGTFDSAHTYTLLWRDLDQAYDASGRLLGWTPDQKQTHKTATLRATDLHKSIGKQLLDVAAKLEDQAAPLTIPARETGATPPLVRAELAVSAAEAEVAAAAARRKGIRKLRQEAVGRGDAEEAAELEEDEAAAKQDLVAAEQAVVSAKQRLEQLRDTSAVDERPQQAQLLSLEAVGVALETCGALAPAALNDALARLLGTSLRFQTHDNDLTVSWTAEVSVPLVGGGVGTYAMSAAERVPVVANTPRLEGAEKRDWQALYAEQFFGEGLSFAQLGQLRGLDGSGKADTTLYKTIRGWLHDRNAAPQTISALMDAPPQVRQVLYRLFTGKAPVGAYEQHLAAVYVNGRATPVYWPSMWAASTHTNARKVLDAVEALNPAGAPTVDVADETNLPNSVLVAVSQPQAAASQVGKRASRSTGCLVADPCVVRIGPWGQGTQPTADRKLGVRRCEHADCAALVARSERGVLVPLVVPELECGNGLICRDCRRSPVDAGVVFPEFYLEPWSGGRRATVVVDGRKQWVGSHVAGEIEAVRSPQKAAHNRGQRKLTNEQQAQALAALEAGESLRSTAKKFGITPRTLTTTLNWRAGRKPVTEAQVREARKLRAAGGTLEDVAAQVGVSVTTLRAKLKDAAA